MELRIVVIIPFYNASFYLNDCYVSLLKQDYKNYRLIFSDDGSTDGSMNLIPENERVTRIRQPERVGTVRNIYNILSTSDLAEDDIVVLVGGEDYLLHARVFYKINELYKKYNCLLTYGQFCTGKGFIGNCSPYTKEEFVNLRKCDWRISHLKSFRFKLFTAFLKQDPQLNAYKDEQGRYYLNSSDIALMYPLPEIAGYENVRFNKNVMYVQRYPPDLPLSFENQLRSKQPFGRAF